MIKQFGLEYNEGAAWNLSFSLETRRVTSLYEQCFDSKRLNVKPWKILVCLCASTPRSDCIIVGGVVEAWVQVDVKDYWSSNEHRKAELALEYLMMGIRRVAEQMMWDIAPFEEARAKVLDAKFMNHRIWKKPVSNEERTLTAEVVVDHQISRALISIVIRDKKSKDVLSIHPVVEDLPDEFIYASHIGKLHWVGKSRVELYARDDPNRKIAVDIHLRDQQ
ncbi:MAG: hypothetical protein ING75_17720 [Rhodocyclaceae bacterium]|nr:hypothetical protein [Rhodocyclaceae bacterium]